MLRDAFGSAILALAVRFAAIGNSEEFDGLRLSFRDKGVKTVRGLSVTLWMAEYSKDARVQGVSIGMAPQTGKPVGLHLGALGAATEHRLAGVAIGCLGIGVLEMTSRGLPPKA